jgi:hypothetical protein
MSFTFLRLASRYRLSVSNCYQRVPHNENNCLREIDLNSLKLTAGRLLFCSEPSKDDAIY